MPPDRSISGAADSATGGGLRERLRHLLLKPPDPDRSPPPARPSRSVEELEAANRSADDRERLVGLIAAPLAAAIAILVVRDEVAHLKAHASTSVYDELLLVLFALSVVMLGTAWFRKRLFLGCAMALYGLAVFNLHYWGFGVPFVLFGAWLLVRAYRAQRDLREALGTLPSQRYGRAASDRSGPVTATKRYTPPSTSRRRRAS